VRREVLEEPIIRGSLIEMPKIRFVAKGVRSQRNRLGLSAISDDLSVLARSRSPRGNQERPLQAGSIRGVAAIRVFQAGQTRKERPMKEIEPDGSPTFRLWADGHFIGLVGFIARLAPRQRLELVKRLGAPRSLLGKSFARPTSVTHFSPS
jgi:hypothetical protein